MRISTQSSGRRARNGRRIPAIIWLLASGCLFACSLLAPSDAYYLSGSSQTESGESGEGGESGQSHANGGARDGVGGRKNGSAGRANLAGEGGSAGSVAGDSNGGEGGDAPLTCDAGSADCNRDALDGCEVDLRSSRENCGGCGKAYACAADQLCAHGSCVSESGCSDGTREGFLPVSNWPRIAGCTAQWPRSSLRDAKSNGGACGFESAVCTVPADACGTGWHVCAIPPFGPTEVSSQATEEECNSQPGAYAIAVGDQACDPCTSTTGAGAACCGDACVQQNGSCIYDGMTAWFGMINNYVNRCGAIETEWEGRGVLCCRSP